MYYYYYYYYYDISLQRPVVPAVLGSAGSRLCSARGAAAPRTESSASWVSLVHDPPSRTHVVDRRGYYYHHHYYYYYYYHYVLCFVVYNGCRL